MSKIPNIDESEIKDIENKGLSISGPSDIYNDNII